MGVLKCRTTKNSKGRGTSSGASGGRCAEPPAPDQGQSQSHTGGVFEREVDKKVQKFLWANAVDQVQDMPRWRHLPDPLPWLPQYATSGAALDAAVAAARSS